MNATANPIEIPSYYRGRVIDLDIEATRKIITEEAAKEQAKWGHNSGWLHEASVYETLFRSAVAEAQAERAEQAERIARLEAYGDQWRAKANGVEAIRGERDALRLEVAALKRSESTLADSVKILRQTIENRTSRYPSEDDRREWAQETGRIQTTGTFTRSLPRLPRKQPA